jgi:phosphoribosylformimino-5-aminoimidazole carboxamide ribonucleotide (ProFAR) isomerase
MTPPSWPRPVTQTSTARPRALTLRPGWVSGVIASHGDQVAVGLDVRGSRLAAREWTTLGGELVEVLARLEADGCAGYVVTDVTKDGTLTGPNLHLLTQVCELTDRPIATWWLIPRSS